MKRHFPVVLLASVCAALPLGAQALTSVTPTRVVQVDPSATGSTREIVLRGTGITPGANAGEDVKRVRFEMRRDGGEWVSPGTAGGGVTSNEWRKVVWSKDWFATPGQVEVRLVVDGRPTNAMPIRVDFAPTTPAEITELSPSHMPPYQSTESVYLFYVRGVRYSDPLEVTVAGVRASFGRVSVDAGEALVYLPRPLRNLPGRYPVVVRTRAGSSLARYVEVDGPPQVASVAPAEVVRERAGTASTVRVKVAFGGAAPTSIRVGNDVVGWVGVPAQEWADSPTAVWVDVPIAMIQRATTAAPQAIQIVLTNGSGSSTGTLVARSDGSAVQIQRINPGVLRPTVPVVRPPVARPPTPAPPRP
ncbi:MAG TPA: hypothetical protein VFH27_18520 [Longimicrobiaceae bacterium]|nr:hypothetical protein [Longimicrobiaceae bacterium]